jgi:CHAT domain-containing protein/tetratricopeptide (TPR) repeat protein
MTFVALLLASVPVLQANEAGKAAPAPIAVHVGERVTRNLDRVVDHARNANFATFEVDVAEPTSVNVSCESLDFDPKLVIEDVSAGTTRDFVDKHRFWRAHGTCELQRATRLRIRVEAVDDRGGEFALSLATGGEPESPNQIDRARAVISESETLAQRLRESKRECLASRFLDVASSAAFAIHEFARARDLAEQQSELARACDGTEQLARARLNLGVAELQLGRSSRAEELLEASLEPVTKLLESADTPEREHARASLLYVVYDRLGDIRLTTRGARDALACYRKAAELAPRTARSEALPEALGKVGFALDELGESHEALVAIEKSVKLAEELTGKPHELTSALLNHARYLVKHGWPADCRRQCERALSLSPLPAIRIELLGTAIEAYLELGRYEQAQASIDELTDLAAHYGITRYEGPTQRQRAWIAFRLGDFSRARRLLEQAADKFDAREASPEHIEVLFNLAQVLTQSGELELAHARFAEAIPLCASSGQRRLEARGLIGLGQLRERECAYTDALAALDRAVEIGDELADRFTTAIALAGRGFVLYRQGQLEAAEEASKRGAIDLERAGEFELAVDAHDTLARVALARSDDAGVATELCAAEQLLALQQVHGLDWFASAGLRSRFAEWGAILQDLVAQSSSRVNLSESERSSLILDGWRQASRWKGRVLLEQMRVGGSASHRAVATLPEPGDAMPHVPAQTAIVEYVDGLEHVFVYVVTTEGVRFIDLGPRVSIEHDAREYLATLVGRTTEPMIVAQQGARLYAKLVSPVTSLLPRGTTQLVLVPTPSLAALPFEALVHPDSVPNDRQHGFDELRYLMDEFVVVHAPSAQVMVALQQRTSATRPPRFLILGDPIFGPEATGEADVLQLAVARPGDLSQDYRRVKGTRDESLEIARLLFTEDPSATAADGRTLLKLADQRSAEMHTARFDMYLGGEARRDRISTDLSAYTHLHLAAHAHVDPSDPRRSGLVLSYEQASQGLFALEDVLGLHLDAELTVLSACETAQGPIVRGEGVQSLAYAFLAAGSRAVIATLWRIEDDKAARIMIEFYRQYLDHGQAPADALRFAKLQFRSSIPARGSQVGQSQEAPVMVAANPYFWASFVYVGAPSE